MISLVFFVFLTNVALAQLACPADNEQTYVDLASQATYRIECGYDRPGADMPGSPGWTDTLEQCIVLCSETSGCVDITYVPGSPGPCYIKNGLNAPVAKAGQIGAHLLSAEGVTCPNPDPVCVDVPDYGTCYYTECDSQRTGNVLTRLITTTFEDCVDECEANYLNGCAYVNFAPGEGTILPGGTCTLQTTYSQTLTSTPGYWGSTRESICWNQNGANETTWFGRTYRLECGTDLYGGDLGVPVWTTGIYGCMLECDQTPGCIGAAWHWGYPTGLCYMKSTVNPADSNSAVNAAVWLPDYSGVSTSTSSFPTSTPTSILTTSATSTPTTSLISTSTTSSTSTSMSTSTSASTSNVCTPNPTGSGVLYGDFECGVPAPWVLQLSNPTTITGSVTQPGLTGNCAVEVEFADEDLDVNATLTSPIVSVAPSTQYKLMWGTYVEGIDGYETASVNGRSASTINVNQYSKDVWVYSQIPWTSLSTETTAQVTFEWVTLGGRLDTVVLSEVTAWCGNNPPLGILPDGEFECGLGAWTVEVPDPTCSAGAGSNAAASGGALGNYAWVVNEPEPPVYSNTQEGVSARILSAPLPVVPGETYMLAFVTYFTEYDLGFIGVMVNDVALYTRDPGDQGQNGPTVFSPNIIFWTAGTGVTNATVRIEALFGAAGTMMVDGVIFTQVNPAWAGKYGE